jgi:hypothetical protein
LNENPVEVAQADTKHNAGTRRLNEQIRRLYEQINPLSWETRKKVVMALITGGVVLAFLPGCILGQYSEKGPNTGSSQTQGVVELYVRNEESEELYNLLQATDIPYGLNGRGFSYPDRTTIPPFATPQN